jgi:hypothetical protein
MLYDWRPPQTHTFDFKNAETNGTHTAIVTVMTVLRKIL